MASWTDTRTQQMDTVTGNAIQAYRNWCPSVGIDEKPLEILESETTYNNNIQIIELSKPSERSDCKIISEDNVGELVQLLHKEAKVI